MSIPGATSAKTSGLDNFDPEIRDIASYVHNYKVDSDLAVRPSHFL